MVQVACGVRTVRDSALAVILLVFVGWSFGLTSALYLAGIALFFEAWAMTGVLQMTAASRASPT